jgi:hypothetical protein
VPTRSFTEADQQVAVSAGERKREEKRSAFDLEPPIAGHQSFPNRFGGHGAPSPNPTLAFRAVEAESQPARCVHSPQRGEGQVAGVRAMEFDSEASEPLTPPSPLRGEGEHDRRPTVTFTLTYVPIPVTS